MIATKIFTMVVLAVAACTLFGICTRTEGAPTDPTLRWWSLLGALLCSFGFVILLDRWWPMAPYEVVRLFSR